MSELNKNEQVNGEKAQAQGQTQNENGQQPPVNNATEPTKAEPEKEGVTGFLKKHWKGVTAGVVTLLSGIGLTRYAYVKGKAAGIMSVPAPQQPEEDYSLNPNIE